MILDAYGRPIRAGNTFLTPDWIKREAAAAVRSGVYDWEAERRVHELRSSIAADLEPRAGQTIHVKLPDRFRS